MKRISVVLTVLTLLCTVSVSAADQWTVKKAKKWAKSGVWNQGFTAAVPHKTTDWTEFASQYENNREVWDALFAWYRDHEHEFTTMAPGRYEVMGTRCFVNVQDTKSQPIEKCGIEGHRQYIDLQYVASGHERFGVVSIEKATPKGDYRPDFQAFEADSKDIKYANSNPGVFFLYFPRNCHQPMIQVGAPEPLRKIVGKIEYVEVPR